MSWAVKKKLLAEVPDLDIEASGGGRLMRGRPITSEEYERMLAKTDEARPRCCDG